MPENKFILRKDKEQFNQVQHSPTNKSSAKQTYSFSKSPRFPMKLPICQKNSYLSSKSKTRSYGIGIGYGIKSDFTKDLTCSPGVGKYNIEENNDKQIHKGYSLGLGRKQITFRSYVDKQKCRYPSANSYKYDMKTNSREITHLYSIKGRTKILDKNYTIDPLNTNPGPADYQEHGIDKATSKLAYKGYMISKSKRFQRIKTDSPGPGYYTNQNTNKVILSSEKSLSSPRFGKSLKTSIIDDAIKLSLGRPGPGSYRYSTQFGTYEN